MNTPTTTLPATRVGLIGCGKIAQAYFNGAKTFPHLALVACADINPEAARQKAEENNCRALSVDELIADPTIDLVINLTIPAAHVEISRRIIEAGKDVYSEKPLGIALEPARDLLALARRKGRLVGCAPDTFFGAGLQTCRDIVDSGSIGRIVSGTAFMLSPGVESWHPNPGFFYLEGGGPVLDMGPYYLTALVHLIGPVKRVSAMTTRTFATRTATSEARFGEVFPVEVDTHATALLEFHSGAIITAAFSFDVTAHTHRPIELYGTEGSLQVPDPNTFNGPVNVYQKALREWKIADLRPLYRENHRGIGVADMAAARHLGRPHRASGELALHVLEVMRAIDSAATAGNTVPITSRPERPASLPEGLAVGALDLSSDVRFQPGYPGLQ